MVGELYRAGGDGHKRFVYVFTGCVSGKYNRNSFATFDVGRKADLTAANVYCSPFQSVLLCIACLALLCKQPRRRRQTDRRDDYDTPTQGVLPANGRMIVVIRHKMDRGMVCGCKENSIIKLTLIHILIAPNVCL